MTVGGALVIGTTLLLAAADGALAPVLVVGGLGYVAYKAVTGQMDCGWRQYVSGDAQKCNSCGGWVSPHANRLSRSYFKCRCGRRWKTRT